MTPVPRCPHCGEPPSHILRASIIKERISFNPDGSRNFHNSKPHAPLPGTIKWMCGDGHVWEYHKNEDPMYEGVINLTEEV
jgi:hypothetical protein